MTNKEQPQKTDWSTKPNYLLRAMYTYRKKHGMPIEPELNDELAKRFPTYDAEQKKFIGHSGRKSKPANEINWDAKKDNTLRVMYAYRKKNGRQIERELNDELTKRFPSYDAEQKLFTGRNRRKSKSAQKIDWGAKTNNMLRTMYAYRKRNGLPIESELNDELAKRFLDYDAEQKMFSTRKINWNEKSDDTLRAMCTYRKKRGLPFEPELNEELVLRFPTYDAEQKIFTGRPGRKKITDISQGTKFEHITNWANISDNVLRNAQKQQSKTAAGIDDALNAELARRFPDEYDATTRTFVRKTKTDIFTSRDMPEYSFATFDPAITQTPQRPQLSVTLKPVKQVLNLTYNNVYVNGKLILRNHANTELKLFGDGTLLGAHGIIKNNPDLPQHPIWIVYDTNLVPNKWTGNKKWAQYNIYVANISPTPDGVNLSLSNRSTVMLENEKLKRRAGIARFEIQR